MVETVGQAHGFLYMVYLVAAFDLGRRAEWPLKRMLLVMLPARCPFVSFYAERRVSGWLAAAQPARGPGAGRRADHRGPWRPRPIRCRSAALRRRRRRQRLLRSAAPPYR